MSGDNRDTRFQSLFVSDLSADITEAMLLNTFCTSGPIASVRIVRHRETRQSLGYGYVNFVRESDARNALNTKNFTEINGRPIRVTAAQSNPNLRKVNNSNVFVKNLDKSVDNKRLYETFKRFGPILSCKLAQEVNGQSKCFGFVQFESEQSAIDAIIAMNGRQLDGKIIFCSKFLPKTQREKYIRNTIEAKNFANIYIKNLSPEFDDNTLKQLFITFGPVIAVQVIHRNSKHFGFVCFADSVAANNAIKVLNGKPLPNGCPVYMSRAFRRVPKNSNNRMTQKRSDGRDICVKYLDDFIDNQKLWQIFSQFGQITGAKAYTPSTSRITTSDSFGFVSFASPDSAQKAVQEMNNTVVANRSLFVSIAQPFNEQNRCLATNSSIKTKRMNNFRNQCTIYADRPYN